MSSLNKQLVIKGPKIPKTDWNTNIITKAQYLAVQEACGWTLDTNSQEFLKSKADVNLKNNKEQWDVEAWLTGRNG